MISFAFVHKRVRVRDLQGKMGTGSWWRAVVPVWPFSANGTSVFRGSSHMSLGSELMLVSPCCEEVFGHVGQKSLIIYIYISAEQA